MSKHFNENEREYVRGWMIDNCLGRANAKFRKQIIMCMPVSINERKLRYIFADLINAADVYSSNAWGYFFMPACNASDSDIDAALNAIRERKSHALSTLTNCDKNKDKVEALRQGQATFKMGRG